MLKETIINIIEIALLNNAATTTVEYMPPQGLVISVK